MERNVYSNGTFNLEQSGHNKFVFGEFQKQSYTKQSKCLECYHRLVSTLHPTSHVPERDHLACSFHYGWISLYRIYNTAGSPPVLVKGHTEEKALHISQPIHIPQLVWMVLPKSSA